MVYEWIPQIIIGAILIVVGIKLEINLPIANLLKLALILIGLVILIWGILGAFDQLTSGL